MLSKIQIKRVLKDHCQAQIREENADLAIDAIAQELIEHEREIVN